MKNICDLLPFTANKEQSAMLKRILKFVDPGNDEDFHIISGPGGTGKTTCTKAIADYLTAKEIQFHIIAPTARAAKVIGGKTGKNAKTIHSHIYMAESLKESAGVRMSLKSNLDRKYAITIVDEASMISDDLNKSETFITEEPLLNALMKYTKEGNTKNKLIFIGDHCQLPPIQPTANGSSPALDETFLEETYKIKGATTLLSEVMRQEGGSPILEMANSIRDCIENEEQRPRLLMDDVGGFNDVITQYNKLLDTKRLDKVCVIGWSNKNVNECNQAIRTQLGFADTLIGPGDIVTTQKTYMCYGTWVSNGDTGIVKSVDTGISSCGGLHFANLTLEFYDSLQRPYTVKAKALLNTLTSEKGELTKEQENGLYAAVMKNNAVYRITKSPRDDAYIGAIRLRYGYAITCHKAQGGEWDHVFLHPKWPFNDLRWLYTAVTRAKSHIYSWAA